MIRTSNHSLKFSNQGKLNTLHDFCDEYRRALQIYVDYIWDMEYHWEAKTQVKVKPNSKAAKPRKRTILVSKTLNIKNRQYDTPKYFPVKLSIPTTLSARALKCCATQAIGMVKAVIKKPSKRMYQLNKLKAEGADYSKLENKINRTPITKPKVFNANIELNSICCGFSETRSALSFDGFITLSSLGKTYGKILLPIKYHRQANKWRSLGTQLKSFLINKNSINMRWEVKPPPLKTEGIIVGADQGKRDVVVFSSGAKTPKADRHNHTLDSIMAKLARKRKGSKAFQKAQDHRTNFINWDIKQLNLDKIKQINLEEIINIGFRKHTSRLMSHWTNTDIENQITKLCEEKGVLLNLQSSIYRSQRCFICGLVRKSNRLKGGKEFRCKGCGASCDADFNAARNHSILLPKLPPGFRSLKLNIKGFLWKPEGIFDLSGKELTVPFSNKKVK